MTPREAVSTIRGYFYQFDYRRLSALAEVAQRPQENNALRRGHRALQEDHRSPKAHRRAYARGG